MASGPISSGNMPAPLKRDIGPKVKKKVTKDAKRAQPTKRP